MSTPETNTKAEIVETGVELVLFDTNAAALTALAEQYAGLVTNGPEDEGALTAVTEARKNMRNIRVALEKKRKEIKQPHFDMCTKIDDEARRLKGMIVPVETRLLDEEAKVTEEVARREAEALRLREEEVSGWMSELDGFGHHYSPAVVREMNLDEFRETRDLAEHEHDKRVAAKAEEDRILKEREEAAAAQEAELAEAAAKLKAEREQFEADQQAENDRRAAEQAERDRVDAEQRAAEQAKRDEEDAARQAAWDLEEQRQQEERDKLEQAEADKKAEEDAAAAEVKAAEEAEAQRLAAIAEVERQEEFQAYWAGLTPMGQVMHSLEGLCEELGERQREKLEAIMERIQELADKFDGGEQS